MTTQTAGVLAGNNKQREGAALLLRRVEPRGGFPLSIRVEVHYDFTSKELRATATAAIRHPQKATHGSHSDARRLSKKVLERNFVEK